MYYPPEHFNGPNRPNLEGLTAGDWFLFCGHCGYQHRVNTIIRPECPECRKGIMHCCRVTSDDMEEAKR